MTIVYDLQHRVAFVHVPKAGGTSLVHTLLNWPGSGFQPYVPPVGPPLTGAVIHASVREARELLQGLQGPSTTPEAEAEAPAPWVMVGVVRHPLRRFVSAFNQTRRMDLHTYPATASGLESFVREVLEPRHAELTGHTPLSLATSDLVRFMAPQTTLLEGADVVLHLENLDPELHAWASTSGCFAEGVLATLQPVALLNQEPTDEGLRVQDLLTWGGSTLDHLTELYEPEAQTYGYSWPL